MSPLFARAQSPSRGPSNVIHRIFGHLFALYRATLTRDSSRPARRIGTEHEKFGFQLDTLKPIEYEAHVQKLLQALVDRFDWEPIMEAGNIIGAKQNGQSVTLEPGGQFELSGAPLSNLHQTCAEVHVTCTRSRRCRASSGWGSSVSDSSPSGPWRTPR